MQSDLGSYYLQYRLPIEHKLTRGADDKSSDWQAKDTSEFESIAPDNFFMHLFRMPRYCDQVMSKTTSSPLITDQVCQLKGFFLKLTLIT